MKRKWHEVHFTCDADNCCQSVIIDNCNNYNTALKIARRRYPNWKISMKEVFCEEHKELSND